MWHVRLLLPCLLAIAASSHSQAQSSQTGSYPSRPVSVVIPFAAGGTTDNEARLYTQKLQENTGQPFVFDFRSGAGTTIGVAYVAKAAADGYTLLVSNSGLTVHPFFYPDLPYEVLKNFAPITLLSNRATALLINPAVLPNIFTIQDLIGFGKSNPDKLNCNTAGAGSITHIVCAALATETRINITPVHYKGVSQGQVDFLAGRTQLQAGTVFNYLAQLKSGKLRAIAVLGDERTRLLPEVKTSLEQGVNVEFPSWLGVLAPAGTPSAILNKLHAEFVKAVRSPDVVKQLEAAGSTPVANSPDAFRMRMATETARWKKIIHENGIKTDE